VSNEDVPERPRSPVADAEAPSAWVDRELSDCYFKDERLGKRFRTLLEQLSSSPGNSSTGARAMRSLYYDSIRKKG
jgi:hypothetical protein